MHYQTISKDHYSQLNIQNNEMSPEISEKNRFKEAASGFTQKATRFVTFSAMGRRVSKDIRFNCWIRGVFSDWIPVWRVRRLFLWYHEMQHPAELAAPSWVVLALWDAPNPAGISIAYYRRAQGSITASKMLQQWTSALISTICFAKTLEQSPSYPSWWNR